MIVQIETFAVLKETLGEKLQVELHKGDTVDQLLSVLNDFNTGSQPLPKIRVVRDNTFLENASELHNADELSLLPPSSGG